MFYLSVSEINSEYLKLILITPAIFTNSDIPKILLSKEYEGISFELIAKSIGKPMNIGGFDMVQKKPKYMYKAVTPGSVYYLKTNNIESAKLLFEKLSKLETLTENGLLASENFKKQGFGKFSIGNVKI